MIEDSSSKDEDDVNIQEKFYEDEEAELLLNAAQKPATTRFMA